MKMTKTQLRQIIKEVIVSEGIKRNRQWYLSNLGKVKFPSGIRKLMRTTKNGDYRWGYIEVTGDPSNIDSKIFFYKNKPVMGTHVTVFDTSNLTYLTDKHRDLDKGEELPNELGSEFESPVFAILQKYKIGQ
jgi:hypothetical protein